MLRRRKARPDQPPDTRPSPNGTPPGPEVPDQLPTPVAAPWYREFRGQSHGVLVPGGPFKLQPLPGDRQASLIGEAEGECGNARPDGFVALADPGGRLFRVD